MKKRILSILLVLLMVMSMLPMTALAVDAGSAVVYGNYVDGAWVQTPGSTGSITDAATGITVSKTATPTANPNEYTITLQVKTGTTTTTVPGKAATVLIIDVSGSMDFCAECGEDYWHKDSCKYHKDWDWNFVTADQSRITAAKAAANSFLNTYSNVTAGSGRYLAVVSFSTSASTVLGWTDVSTSDGKTSAENAISGLSANGGTNLDAALRTATGLMGDQTVSSLKNKFTVALTDGAPTKSKSYGDGTLGSADINKETAASATALKNLCTLYTVCFGASDDLCWEGKRGEEDGPKVGDFLRGSIATTGCAYDAANTAALNKAFESITEDITSSIDLSGATVTDPMADRITCTLPSDVSGVSGDGSGFVWTLSEGRKQNGGGYIYTLTYTITLNTTGEFNESQYYPTNGDTYLTLADGTTKIHFPVPAVKGVAPRYTVTYAPGEHGTFEAQVTQNLHYGDATPAAPTVTGEAGWSFNGWDTTPAATVTETVTYTATWTQNEYTVTYAPGAHGTFEAQVTPNLHYGDATPAAPTVTGEAGWTFAGWDTTPDTTVTGNATYVAQWELIPVASLSVTKTANDTKASVGDTISWTIVVKNDGNVKLTDITLVDTLTDADGKTIGNVVLTGAVGYPVSSFALEAGESATFTATYQVRKDDAGKTIYNTVVAGCLNGPKDEDTSIGTEIRPNTPIIPMLPVLNTEDHVAYIIGYADDTVRPENNITRAEVATIFFRLLSDDSRAYYWTQKNDYSDVSRGDWFNNAVSTLSNAGIITGYPDGTFRPNAPITRAEFAAIAARFSDTVYSGKNTFSDVPSTHWAARCIALAEHLGWVSGYPDGTFRPDKSITRAEAMTLINRVLDRAVDAKHMLPGMVTWRDNSPSAWYYEDVQEATNSHEYTRLTSVIGHQGIRYESWTKILPVPDWDALEKSWSTAYTK